MRFSGRTESEAGRLAAFNNIPKMLGRAIASLCYPRAHCEGRSIRVAVARDVRLSSPKIERNCFTGFGARRRSLLFGRFAHARARRRRANAQCRFFGHGHGVPQSAVNNGLKSSTAEEKLTPEEEESLDRQILTRRPATPRKCLRRLG